MATAFASLAEDPPGETPGPVASVPPAEPPAAPESPPARGGNPLAGKVAGWLKDLLAPLTGIAIFLALWAVLAPQVQTSLGALPGPGDVAAQGVALF